MRLNEAIQKGSCLFYRLNLFIVACFNCISAIAVLGVHLDLDHDSKEDLFFTIEELKYIRVSSLFLL